MRSRFAKKWVNITLNGDDGYIRVFIEKVGLEADKPVYVCKYEDGTRETIFVDSVFRILPVFQKKSRVIDFASRRKKILRLMR